MEIGFDAYTDDELSDAIGGMNDQIDQLRSQRKLFVDERSRRQLRQSGIAKLAQLTPEERAALKTPGRSADGIDV